MEDIRRGFMAQDQPEESAPRGGLMSDALGGLSKFLGNVNKGIDAVMSHPLYERAWSGMVSGMTGDPMAGPMAVSQLKQMAMNQQMQQTQIKREEEDYTNSRHLDLLRQSQINDLQGALRSRDQARIHAAYAALDPMGAAKMALTPAKAPALKAVLRDGRPVYVPESEAIGMEPYKTPLVQIGDAGLKPSEQYAVEDRAASGVASQTDKLQQSLDAYDAFESVLATINARDGIPTLAESDTLAKLASRVETGEAVNEGDITRKSGGGFANAARAKAGIGIMMSPQTMQEVATTTRAVAEARRKRLMEIQRGAQDVAAGRGLNPNAVAPLAPAPKPPKDAPPGAKPHPTIPGLWVDDAGNGYVD